MNETKELVKWLVNLKYEDLPDIIIDFTKRIILDDIGCMLGGALQLGNKAIVRDIINAGENTNSTIAYYGIKTCTLAALANGAFIAVGITIQCC